MRPEGHSLEEQDNSSAQDAMGTQRGLSPARRAYRSHDGFLKGVTQEVEVG